MGMSTIMMGMPPVVAFFMLNEFIAMVGVVAIYCAPAAGHKNQQYQQKYKPRNIVFHNYLVAKYFII
jgi:hypothetical protein